MLSRLMMACADAKQTLPEWWNTFKSDVRRRKMGNRLRLVLRRLETHIRVTSSQVLLFVRDRLARNDDVNDRLEEEGVETSLSAAESHGLSIPLDPHSSSLQPLQIVTSPLKFLRMCRNDQASAQPSPSLLSAKSILGGKQHRSAREDGEEEENWSIEADVGEATGTTGTCLALPKPPFSANELERYLVQAIHSPVLDDQLKSVPREDETLSKTVAGLPSNIRKNRYKNNLPYDDTRVVLKSLADSDYINASYIKGLEDPRMFIAAQGPKGANESTIFDFWAMVWQSNSNVIVMVANLMEGGREKVFQYWPDVTGVKESYGKVMVTMELQRKFLDCTIRHFLVSMDNHSRQVVHYQYTAWPDHNSPSNPLGAAIMIKSICKWQWTGPPIIHCSAGLGRTGTILLVLQLLDDLRTRGRFHPPKTLYSLRKCRASLLDNQLQYRFAHHVLLEILFGQKTKYPLTKFSDYFASSRRRLHNQYQELKSFPTGLTYNWARKHNPILNRDSSVLPGDGRQVPLMVQEDYSMVQNDNAISLYVNAVRVRGLNLRDTFLVTEHPMIHTVGRVWKLAYMTRASAWVFLHNHLPADEKDFPSVFPTGGYGELEGITVQVDGKVENQLYTEVSITLSQGEPHSMSVIQFKSWRSSEDLPDSKESLLSLLTRLEEIRRRSPYRFIMISCSDGYSGSGVLVALSRLVAEARSTQHVDVFRGVQSLLFDRPQFIKSEKQYYYLHDVVALFYQQMKEWAVKRNPVKQDGLQHRRGNEDQVQQRNIRVRETNRRESQKRISGFGEDIKNTSRKSVSDVERKSEHKEREQRQVIEGKQENERRMVDEDEKRADAAGKSICRIRQEERMGEKKENNFRDKEQTAVHVWNQQNVVTEAEPIYERLWDASSQTGSKQTYQAIWETK